MKINTNLKKTLVCVILASTILCSAACSKKTEETPSPTPEANIQSDVYEEKIAYCLQQIASLESQLAEKKQEIYVSESQYQLEIAALEATIASLKAQINTMSSTTTQKPSDTNNQNQGNQNQGNQNQGNQNQGNQNQGNQNQGNQNQNDQSQSGTELQSSNFTYIKENSGVTITKYTGNDSEVIIPKSIDGQRVLCIGESAFAASTVKSVIIPEGVQKIDWFAFQACTQLVEITIPASVTKIEYGAFDYAKPAFVIKCSKGSFVEAYAKSWGYICVTK